MMTLSPKCGLVPAPSKHSLTRTRRRLYSRLCGSSRATSHNPNRSAIPPRRSAPLSSVWTKPLTPMRSASFRSTWTARRDGPIEDLERLGLVSGGRGGSDLPCFAVKLSRFQRRGFYAPGVLLVRAPLHHRRPPARDGRLFSPAQAHYRST